MRVKGSGREGLYLSVSSSVFLECFLAFSGCPAFAVLGLVSKTIRLLRVRIPRL